MGDEEEEGRACLSRYQSVGVFIIYTSCKCWSHYSIWDSIDGNGNGEDCRN